MDKRDADITGKERKVNRKALLNRLRTSPIVSEATARHCITALGGVPIWEDAVSKQSGMNIVGWKLDKRKIEGRTVLGAFLAEIVEKYGIPEVPFDGTQIEEPPKK